MEPGKKKVLLLCGVSVLYLALLSAGVLAMVRCFKNERYVFGISVFVVFAMWGAAEIASEYFESVDADKARKFRKAELVLTVMNIALLLLR